MKLFNINSYIKGLKIPHRGNCPSCGNKHTFIANVNNGNLFYYCFHNSCSLKGKANYEVSVDELRAISNNPPVNLARYELPNYFTSPLQNNGCYNFLHRSGLIDFYSKHVDLIRYDPKQHRCVFVLKDKEGIKGAVGRNLGIPNSPKWLVYTRHSGCPFLLRQPKADINEAQALLIVEDAVSACVASEYFNSCSILGTHCSQDTIPYLVGYSKLVIALDDDALAKSVKLQKQLNLYRPTFIVPLLKDIKYFNKTELETLRKEIECLK